MAKTVHRPLSPRGIIRIVHQEPWTRIVHHSHNSALIPPKEMLDKSRSSWAIHSFLLETSNLHNSALNPPEEMLDKSRSSRAMHSFLLETSNLHNSALIPPSSPLGVKVGEVQ